MAEISCPYCNEKKCMKIVYSYNGVNKRKNKNIDYSEFLKEGTVFREKKKYIKKLDFDGTHIPNRLVNRYCPSCKNDFHSVGKMYLVDVKHVCIVIENHCSRDRFDFDFIDPTNPICFYRKNYLLKSQIVLTEEDRNKILLALKDSEFSKWPGYYGNWNKVNNDYWIVKLVYQNGLSECKSGKDKYPKNWNTFISIIAGFIDFNKLK